jgi:hypothetical protein
MRVRVYGCGAGSDRSSRQSGTVLVCEATVSGVDSTNGAGAGQSYARGRVGGIFEGGARHARTDVEAESWGRRRRKVAEDGEGEAEARRMDDGLEDRSAMRRWRRAMTEMSFGARRASSSRRRADAGGPRGRGAWGVWTTNGETASRRRIVSRTRAGDEGRQREKSSPPFCLYSHFPDSLASFSIHFFVM